MYKNVVQKLPLGKKPGPLPRYRGPCRAEEVPGTGNEPYTTPVVDLPVLVHGLVPGVVGTDWVGVT